MATIREYIAESVKTYAFKVKIAGDCGDKIEERIKTALMKYDCASVSKGKRTPIQETPLDFPDLKNAEVTIFDVECRYPATSQVVTEYLVNTLKLNHSNIRVRNPKEDEEVEHNLEAINRVGTSTASILNKPYEEENHQDLVGEKQKLSFLKELEKVKRTTGEEYKGQK